MTYFLNGSRRGYCMHYASAAVLLLRTVGIPARYVSGFAAVVPPPGGWMYRIPLHTLGWRSTDGYGWYPVEVTQAMAAEGEQRRWRPHPPSQTPHRKPPPHPPGPPRPGRCGLRPHSRRCRPTAPTPGMERRKGRPAPAVDGSAWPWPDPVGGSLPPAASPAGKSVCAAWSGRGGQSGPSWRPTGTSNACCPGADRRTPGWRSWPLKAKFSQHRLTEKRAGEAAALVLREADGWTPRFPVWSGWPSAICGPVLMRPN